MPIAGYGQIRINRQQSVLTHRLAWELAAGEPLLPGQQIGHICDNRICVRNDDAGTYAVDGELLPRFGHLFLCTQAQNLADMIAKGRGGLHQHPPKGSLNNSSKLTEAEVSAILANHQRYGGQFDDTQLGARYGVTRAAIWLIVHRHNWTHVPLPTRKDDWKATQ